MDSAALAAGELTTTLPLDLRFPWVAPADIATIAAVRMLSPAWSGRVTQGVHGPVDLSFSDVAAVLGRVLGRTVTARRVGENDVATPLRGSGLSEKQVDGILGMARGMQSGFSYENARSLLTTTSTTLAAWAQEHLTTE
ncbi:hypothetical protein [Mycetocola manganoxydans]|uniref:hypothetical protein n=1 Tax=Mycetocola manganoxydans TaxID=699879 RepID=UPI0019A5B919|nr:hypothetical protein [Mycetocola manganoxydans]GHD40884.1 hypothetical protein GCM10008097_05470 [Mycetocola manganoxydans]